MPNHTSLLFGIAKKRFKSPHFAETYHNALLKIFNWNLFINVLIHSMWYHEAAPQLERIFDSRRSHVVDNPL